jgi:hypothetical protein
MAEQMANEFDCKSENTRFCDKYLISGMQMPFVSIQSNDKQGAGILIGLTANQIAVQISREFIPILLLDTGIWFAVCAAKYF